MKTNHNENLSKNKETMMKATTTVPKVGMGATEQVGSDRYPYQIVRVSVSGKTFWMKPVEYKLKPGFSTYGTENQEYDFGNVREQVVETRVHLRKNGRWVATDGRCPVSIGHMDAYQDPCF